ncbi:MAG: lipoprotein [Candidatus Omnitrophica bacterium]|nr:lipoprotein [Candidatus Omnitrophota bacterium]
MKKILLTIIVVFALSGCATSVRYVSYTGEKFIPKDKYYFVTMYDAQPPSNTQVYTVIGKVEISGLASNGVSPELLKDQAKAISRKKGADAIINTKIEAASFSGVYAYTERSRYRHYRVTEYIPYSDQRLTLSGELILFSPTTVK